MATLTWKGGRGDWSDSNQWASTAATSPYPHPGDIATIASGDATISGAEGLDGSIYDGVGLMLGDGKNDPAELDLSGAALGSFFSIQAAGSATIAAQGACAIACPIVDNVSGSVLTLDGATSNPNGLILADGDSINIGQSGAIGAGGSLKLQGLITDENASGLNVYGDAENDGTVKVIAASGFNVYGAFTGTGTVDVSNAAAARFYGSVSAGQTITFGDVAGRLLVANAGDFQGVVDGFAPGDLIDFSTIDAAAASYDAATQTLTLTNSSNQAVAVLNHVQAAAGALTVTPDSGGTGTTVSYTGAPPRIRYEIADGDRAMRSDVVRQTMTVPGTATPITGAGVKVGIISTSFDLGHTANANAAAGYLPANPDGTSAVQVLQEGASGNDDEGQAMAELVHQVAPGAAIDFAAGGDSVGEYENAVKLLTQAGCNVIADDITYSAQPFYQVGGGLDSAVESAVASGVNFFTSAGNFGQAFLEAPFASQARLTMLNGVAGLQQAEVFSNGTPYEPITIKGNSNARIDLQYTAPYEGVGNTGAPQVLTLKVYDANGDLLTTDANGGTTGTPGTGAYVGQDGVGSIDQYFDLPKAATDTTYSVAIYLNGNQLSPSQFKFILTGFGNGTGPGGIIDDPAAGQGSGDARGQQLVPGVNTVGASDFANSAAFGGAPTYDEHFSDPGPGTLFYDESGNPLPAPQSAGKVDFDAPDAIYTNGISSPGFAPFFGTSAAAPDAAAVAALMLQANPDLTTSQITSLLEQSAITQGLPAAQQGTGFIQADRAVSLAIAAPKPTPAPSGGTPGPTGPTASTTPMPAPSPTPAPDPAPAITSTPPVPTPTTTPPTTTPPAPAPVDAVLIAPTVTYADGAFTLTGAASSTAGVANVEIFATVADGMQTQPADLGPAAVNPDGTWSFQDAAGPQQSFLAATVTDDAGDTATSADPGFALTGGLGPQGRYGQQQSFSPAGEASMAVFRPNGQRFLSLEAPGQTVDLGPNDIVANHHLGDNRFVFTPGDGADVLGGYQASGLDTDSLALPSSEFKNFAAVLRDTSDVNGSALISDPKSGEGIYLQGTSVAQVRRNPREFTFYG